VTVFVNRVRQAYIRKRSSREMMLATLCFIAFVGLLGVAGRDQVREEEMMEEAFTRDRRICIVEWSKSVPVYEVGK